MIGRPIGNQTNDGPGLLMTWIRNHMETVSALSVTGEFPSQGPVTRSFDVCFDLRLNKCLSKQSRSWWFETPWRSLWRHCNEYVPHASLGQHVIAVCRSSSSNFDNSWSSQILLTCQSSLHLNTTKYWRGFCLTPTFYMVILSAPIDHILNVDDFSKVLCHQHLIKLMPITMTS